MASGASFLQDIPKQTEKGDGKEEFLQEILQRMAARLSWKIIWM